MCTVHLDVDMNGGMRLPLSSSYFICQSFSSVEPPATPGEAQRMGQTPKSRPQQKPDPRFTATCTWHCRTTEFISSSPQQTFLLRGPAVASFGPLRLDHSSDGTHCLATRKTLQSCSACNRELRACRLLLPFPFLDTLATTATRIETFWFHSSCTSLLS